MTKPNLSGNWLSRYSYQSSSLGASDLGEHMLTFESEGNGAVIGRSLPQNDGSELEMHLVHDAENNVLTGFWREKTSLAGHYKGTVFHGALQLILNVTNDLATGAWVGFNNDHTKVKSGEWRIERQ